ncbi:unnamed protein product [Linum trigynum]|uniref:Uncharacterized protein n=1 Tax=Linum trigynum TaxID=586398 RepID=A0AAV2GD07_9ROSI
MYRWACDRLKETPSFEAFRMIYNIRESTNCWSIGRRENPVGFLKRAPKLDSSWYSGDTEPLTGYAAGLKDDWCASSLFPQ